jgi:hypothetical protein
MRKIIVSTFLVLTFLSSPAMGEMAADWLDKTNALWDASGGKFTDPKKAIEYLNNAIKLKPDYVEAYNNTGGVLIYCRAITILAAVMRKKRVY